MPTHRALKVLVVEDNPRDAKLIVTTLERAGFRLTIAVVDSPAAFQEQLEQTGHEIIISDYNLRSWTAMEALEIVKKSGKDIPLIVVSGTLDDEAAVQCIKQGATDYILKDRTARLASAIERALQEKNSRDERKRLEQQLRQAQKMEAVGRLAGGVAHDFNNLLTIITGYSDLLLEEMQSGSQFRGQIEEIKKAAERAATLTRQLLAFGRRQVLAPQVLNLNKIVASIDQMLRRLIGEDIDLVTKLDPALSRTRVDPSQVEQVIMNLAVNSRDAMPEGGKLTIETANAELDADYARRHAMAAPGGYVMLAVSDTGCGMDTETQSHIFEPFFTTKETGKGTGLGLATVYGIVKQIGGEIWVYSEPGRGTTFKVYFPQVREGEQTVEPPKVVPASHRGSETILVVEDEEAVRSLVVRVLASKGYTVLSAPTPEKAVRLCEQQKVAIDLLLTDVVMPGMSGRKLAYHMGFSRPGMKVLYMSGYSDNAIVHQGVLDPGTAFLQKPFTPNSILRKVREVLDTVQ